MISLVSSLPNLIYSLIMLDLKIQYQIIFLHINHLKVNQCIQIILINYDDYINYYRIYFFNISRQIIDDNAKKFINILTGLETSACEVYVVFKTSASITMKYSKNDKIIVCKSQ